MTWIDRSFLKSVETVAGLMVDTTEGVTLTLVTGASFETIVGMTVTRQIKEVPLAAVKGVYPNMVANERLRTLLRERGYPLDRGVTYDKPLLGHLAALWAAYEHGWFSTKNVHVLMHPKAQNSYYHARSFLNLEWLRLNTETSAHWRKRSELKIVDQGFAAWGPSTEQDIYIGA